MIQKIKEEVDFEINSIQFVNRDGFKYLDIELPDIDLNEIEKKTRVILEIIRKIDNSSDDYYLNVFSSGTEKEIDLKNIGLFINQYLQVRTNKHYLDKNEWEGNLIENKPEEIVIKINNKGRIQKLTIEKKNISFIKTTAQIKKMKKD